MLERLTKAAYPLQNDSSLISYSEHRTHSLFFVSSVTIL